MTPIHIIQKTWDIPLNEADENMLLTWLTVNLYDRIANQGQPGLQEALDHIVQATHILFENNNVNKSKSSN